jgi:hypothetical protein
VFFFYPFSTLECPKNIPNYPLPTAYQNDRIQVGGERNYMLTQMLEQTQSLDTLPLPQKTILFTLAGRFQQSTEYLFLNPEELQQTLNIGTVDQWKELLLLQETQNFIKGQMAFISQISQRKTFQSLVEMALDGNQQAAKQVQELSGIMNQQDQNRVVVLHKIPRREN